MTKKREYRKIGGSGFGVASSSSLWLGRDHLLVVTRMPGGESYRCCFLRDIQAVVVRPSNRRLVLNIVLGLLGALSALVVLSAIADTEMMPLMVFAGPVLVMSVVLLIINNVRGPSCETRFKTAVQYQPVAALSRHRRTAAVLKILRPLILAAQSEASADGAPAREVPPGGG